MLRWLWGVPAQHFTSQAMDRVDATAIEAIELDLVRSAVAEFGVEVRGLIYDATNFFTYINTRTVASIPQRGHNKQKRRRTKGEQPSRSPSPPESVRVLPCPCKRLRGDGRKAS